MPRSSASASAACSRSRPPRAARTGSRRSSPTSRRTAPSRTRRRSPGSGASPTTRHGRTRTAGPGAAAETFLRAVAGDAAWDRLPERARGFLAREGDGALADSGLTGLDPDGLARITAPVAILTGGASEPFYAPIADELAAGSRAPAALTLDGATHTTPITDPAPVAAAIRACLEIARMTEPARRRPTTPLRRLDRARATRPPRPRSASCSTGSPAATTS